MDLLDWHRGGLSFRRLLVLVRHLPPESATRRLERGGRPHWTETHDLIDALRMDFRAAHGVKDPSPYPTSPAGVMRAEAEVERQARVAARAAEVKQQAAVDERVAELARRMAAQEVA